MNEFWSWSVTVQNECFSLRFYWKSINAEPETSRTVQNRFLSSNLALKRNLFLSLRRDYFSLRNQLRNNQFRGWEAWLSRINSFLQELHCNWINSNAEAWLFRINAFLKELYWKWINSEAEAWLCRINAFSMRIVSKMNEFWSWSVTVQN